MDAIRIGDRLIEEGTITLEQLEEALAKQKEVREGGVEVEKSLIGIVLINLGYITQQDLMACLFEKKPSEQKKLSMAEEIRLKAAQQNK